MQVLAFGGVGTWLRSALENTYLPSLQGGACFWERDVSACSPASKVNISLLYTSCNIY